MCERERERERERGKKGCRKEGRKWREGGREGALGDPRLPGLRDSESALPLSSQEPICSTDSPAPLSAEILKTHTHTHTHGLMDEWTWERKRRKGGKKKKTLRFFFTGLSSFQESVAMDRIQRIMGVLQNPHMG